MEELIVSFIKKISKRNMDELLLRIESGKKKSLHQMGVPLIPDFGRRTIHPAHYALIEYVLETPGNYIQVCSTYEIDFYVGNSTIHGIIMIYQYKNMDENGWYTIYPRWLLQRCS